MVPTTQDPISLKKSQEYLSKKEDEAKLGQERWEFPVFVTNSGPHPSSFSLSLPLSRTHFYSCCDASRWARYLIDWLCPCEIKKRGYFPWPVFRVLLSDLLYSSVKYFACCQGSKNTIKISESDCVVCFIFFSKKRRVTEKKTCTKVK